MLSQPWQGKALVRVTRKVIGRAQGTADGYPETHRSNLHPGKDRGTLGRGSFEEKATFFKAIGVQRYGEP